MKSRSFSRRDVLRRSAIAAATVVGGPFISVGRYRVFAQTSTTYSARAIKLVSESVVIDMLGLLALGPNRSKWMKDPDSFTEADLQRFKDSGITAFHTATGVGGPDAYENSIWFLSAQNGFAAANSGAFGRIDSVDDFRRLKDAKKIGIVLGVQNSEHFRTPADIDAFYNLGQRISQLTYNRRNLIGNGSTERADEGLSDFGVSIIAKMNEVGMAVDVSHCGDRTSLDAFEVSKTPVLITHSNARALNPNHPRCKPDEVIRACGKAGSVMGITGVRNFVKDKEPTTIEDYLDHIAYVAKLIGIEHVGIGSDIDLDGYDDMPAEDYARLKSGYKGSYAFRDKIDIEGIDHPKRMFDVAEGLIRRRYSDADIAGILGGHWMRVLKQSWTPMRAPSPTS